MGPILIIGQGYSGTAFAAECRARGIKFEAISRSDCDYSDYKLLHEYISQLRPELVINCAAYIPLRSVDDCKLNRPETLKTNVMLPVKIRCVCESTNTPMAHISTACLFDDKREYSETDEPTRDLTNGHCAFYLRTKLLSEQLIEDYPKAFVWRIRLIFDRFDNPRNYLTKLRSFPKVWDHSNSLSHRGDYVSAALDLWKMRAPFGVYNLVNKGIIPAVEIIAEMAKHGLVSHVPQFIPGPCTGSTLSTAKLEATGVKIRDVREAVEDSLENWKA
jgi:dTDP-4-dehydrorhamnose reductase